MNPNLQVLEIWAQPYRKLDHDQPGGKSEGHGREIFDKNATPIQGHVGGLRLFGVGFLVCHLFCLLSAFADGDPKLLFSVVSIVSGRMDASKRPQRPLSFVIFVIMHLNVNAITQESPDVSLWKGQAAILGAVDLYP